MAEARSEETGGPSVICADCHVVGVREEAGDRRASSAFTATAQRDMTIPVVPCKQMSMLGMVPETPERETQPHLATYMGRGTGE